MGWLKLTLAVDRERVDAAEAALEPFDPLSVTVSDAGDEPVLEPEPGASPLWSQCRLEALFDLSLEVGALRDALEQVGLSAPALDFVDDADWQERWRQYAVDYCFADRLWLVPRDAAPPGEPALRLDPGLAFGTGSHPTTRLCLDWLARTELDGLQVLDYGCGSGILGLAALKLGCSELLAIDHDPQALLATQENAAYNALAGADRLVVGGPDALGDRTFDVVLANILANPLISLADRLAGALRPGGVLVLSGLLLAQASEVQGAYPTLDLEAPVMEDDAEGRSWVRLVGKRTA
ncbi:MAG: 50S ribosomal protein L11 methyltransferase [Pseudomonadota bacterium]